MAEKQAQVQWYSNQSAHVNANQKDSACYLTFVFVTSKPAHSQHQVHPRRNKMYEHYIQLVTQSILKDVFQVLNLSSSTKGAGWDRGKDFIHMNHFLLCA